MQPEREYFILSLKHSILGHPLMWWGPSGAGYTRYVDEAGVYPESKVLADHRLSSHPNNRAVPVEEVRKRVSPAPARVDGLNLRRPDADVVTRIHLRALNRDWLAAAHAGTND